MNGLPHLLGRPIQSCVARVRLPTARAFKTLRMIVLLSAYAGRPRLAAGTFYAGVSVAVRTRPDERVAFFAFHLDQRGVDRSREAWVVQLDREIVAVLLL